jgi:hypothetical protein
LQAIGPQLERKIDGGVLGAESEGGQLRLRAWTMKEGF